ncbi:MAG: hypothetical protein P8Z37_14920 [Acidobacteriota bacterium]
MKAVKFLMLVLMLSCTVTHSIALETGKFRLLSISESEKLILVSKIEDKSKYLLDVAAAKITIGENPAELDKLQAFTVIHVNWKKSDDKRNGVKLDGIALEIEVELPEDPE